MELVGGMAARRVGSAAASVHAVNFPPATNPNAPGPRRSVHPVPPPLTGQRAISRDVVREVENGQVVWRIRCGDMINRDRCVTVFVDNGQIVMTGPPGETARLSAGQIGQLKAVLTEAAKLAER